MNKLKQFIGFCFILFTILIMARATYAKETTYSRFKVKIYNDVWKSLDEHSARLNYDEKSNDITLYISETLYTTAYQIDDKGRQQLIDLISKYVEWNKKADAKGVTLDKEIGRFPAIVWFKIGDGDWEKSGIADISVHFFSQKIGKHQLVIISPKVTSIYNEYSSYKPEALYFDYLVVKKFKQDLSREGIQKAILKLNKQKSIESEFN